MYPLGYQLSQKHVIYVIDENLQSEDGNAGLSAFYMKETLSGDSKDDSGNVPSTHDEAARYEKNLRR